MRAKPPHQMGHPEAAAVRHVRQGRGPGGHTAGVGGARPAAGALGALRARLHRNLPCGGPVPVEALCVHRVTVVVEECVQRGHHHVGGRLHRNAIFIGGGVWVEQAVAGVGGVQVRR